MIKLSQAKMDTLNRLSHEKVSCVDIELVQSLLTVVISCNRTVHF